MYPQPQQNAPEAGGGRPFDASARDAVRSQQVPQQQQMQGQYPQQQPVMAPAAQMPYTLPGEPASPIPQGQPSSQVQPGVAAVFGLPVPPVQTPQQQPQQQPIPGQPQPQQAPAPVMSWFQQGYPQPPQQQQQQPQQAPVQQQAPVNPDPNLAAWVQQQSEAAYGTALFRAMNEPEFLNTLATSQNQVEQEMAKKILERNSEHFGAGTLTEFQAKLELEKAGDDPVKQELARVRMQQADQEKQMKDMQWNAWKASNGLKDDEFGKLADAVRNEFPAAKPADIVHIARGRAGISTTQPTIQEQPGLNSAGGGSQGSKNHEQGISAEGMALFNLNPALQEQTESYMRAIGAVR